MIDKMIDENDKSDKRIARLSRFVGNEIGWRKNGSFREVQLFYVKHGGKMSQKIPMSEQTFGPFRPEMPYLI